MKTTFSKSENFKPVTMTVTFETQKELDVYGSIFECAPFTDAIEDLGVKPIDYHDFREAGAEFCYVNDFLEKLMQTPYMVAYYKKI